MTDTGRIMGKIAIARSIGDRDFQPHVTCHPYIRYHKIEDDDDYLILACDRVWDVLSHEAAVQLIGNYITNGCGSLQTSALMLRDYAFQLRSGDNISTMVLGLKPKGAPTPIQTPKRATTIPKSFDKALSMSTSPTLVTQTSMSHLEMTSEPFDFLPNTPSSPSLKSRKKKTPGSLKKAKSLASETTAVSQ